MGYAITGVGIAFREELSFKLQIIGALMAISLGVFLKISRGDFIIVFLLITLVLVIEVINTALEELCDKFTLEHDPHIGKIKDLGAAASLLASLGALAAGILLFIPYILPNFQ